MKHLLVIDDEPKIRNLLQRYLEGEGYTVSVASSLKQAKFHLKQSIFQLILLDLRLGDGDGLSLLGDINSLNYNVGVIILSGKGEVIDKIVGLELGADDYLAKPFHLREVHARIKTILRRIELQEDTTSNLPMKKVKFGKWKMEPERKHLEDTDGNHCKLTSGEFKLLEAFVANPQRVLSRAQLMDITLGRSYDPFDRTIDTQVRRLRKKLEDNPQEPGLIKTVRGSGYVFTEKAVAVSDSQK